MADRADQRLAQLVGLRAHARLADGMGDAEPFERGGGVGQHRVDADAQFVERSFDSRPRLIAMTPNSGALRRHRAHQPDLAALGRHRHAGRGIAAAGRDLGHFAEHLLRHRDAGAPSAAVRCLARAGEQHDLALHDGGEVVFDRGMNVGHVERHRQPARKGVKIAQVDLALARHLQLTLEAGGELAHHHRDEDEQDQIDDFLRIRDAEAVERRIEEEGGGEHAADRGNDRRHDAPARRRDHHRDQIDHGAVGRARLPRPARKAPRSRRATRPSVMKTPGNSLRMRSNFRASCIALPGGGRVPSSGRNIRRATLVCLGALG